MQVLQRKTEEAAVATKRLKEVLAARKPLPKETQPQTAGTIPGAVQKSFGLLILSKTCCIVHFLEASPR
jgi:hypothetical protein